VKGLFVTGTDTGVGKTFVTAALASRLSGRGWRVAAVKPAESGCELGPGGLVAADAETIAVAAGDWQATTARCLYRMRAGVAPGVAARSEGVAIDLVECVAFVKAVAAQAEVVLVEGAGGWRVPLDGHGLTIADLARRIGLPVLIVARAGLGTINHAVLTAEAIHRDGCELAAVVLSVRPGEDLAMAMSNADEIARQIQPADVRVLREPSDVEALLDRFTWNARSR
jgi:dethiobiotin synthetase